MILIPCARTISHPASCKPTEHNNIRLGAAAVGASEFSKYYASSPATLCEEIELKCLVRLSLRSIVEPRPQHAALPPKAIGGLGLGLGPEQRRAGAQRPSVRVQWVEPLAKPAALESARDRSPSPRIEEIANYVDTANQACAAPQRSALVAPKPASASASNGLSSPEPDLRLATPCDEHARLLPASIGLISDTPISAGYAPSPTVELAPAHGPVYFVRRRPMIMISYCRSEAKNYALLLKRRLEDLCPSLDIFLDLDEIHCGYDWHDSLNRAVLQCDLFVALVTPTYGETLWTSRELKLADQFGKPIVPVNFGQLWPPKCLAIQLATRQFIPWKSSRKPESARDSAPTLRSARWAPKHVDRVAAEIYASLGRFYGSERAAGAHGSSGSSASSASSLDSSGLDPFRAKLGRRNKLGSLTRRPLLPAAHSSPDALGPDWSCQRQRHCHSASSASSSASEQAARGRTHRTLWHRIFGRSLELVEPDI